VSVCPRRPRNFCKKTASGARAPRIGACLATLVCSLLTPRWQKARAQHAQVALAGNFSLKLGMSDDAKTAI
jgi:hypothetical protein